MKSKKPSEYKIAIFGAFIGVFFTGIYDLIKEKPILSTFWNILKWIWMNFFEYKINIWQILFVLTIIYIIKKFKPKKEKQISGFLKYKTDTFENIIWKWKWEWNPLTSEWNVKNLLPICTKCETSTQLNESFMENFAICPRCNNRLSRLKSSDKIEAIIIDNIDRKLHLGKITEK